MPYSKYNIQAVCLDGNTRSERQIVSTNCLCDISFVFVCAEHDQPYVIAVMPKYIEIRTVDPRLLVQNIEIKDPKYITSGRSECYLCRISLMSCAISRNAQNHLKFLFHNVYILYVCWYFCLTLCLNIFICVYMHL